MKGRCISPSSRCSCNTGWWTSQTLTSHRLYPYGEIRGRPIGRDFNVPNPEGLEGVSNWTNLGINSQQASATMKTLLASVGLIFDYSFCFVVLLSCEETWEGGAVIAYIFCRRLVSCKSTRITRKRGWRVTVSHFFCVLLGLTKLFFSWRRRLGKREGSICWSCSTE